jgi:apoptosis-inducing factor 3
LIDGVRHQVAGNQGRAVGSSIAGKPQPFVKVPIFWSARALFSSFTTVVSELLIAEGQQLRYCGYGAKYEDILIKGDPNDLKVLGYLLI